MSGNLIDRHLIVSSAPVRKALAQLETLGADAVVFVVDEEGRLQSSLTDGDIRRGLIRGLNLDSPLSDYTEPGVKYLQQLNFSIEELRKLRSKNYGIIPVIDRERHIVDIVNFRTQRSYLPLQAIIMAGGMGSRLRPLTDTVPKPLLKVGDYPILEHNVRRLLSFGIKHITISVRYLGEQIVEHFGDGGRFGLKIDYLWEEEPRGTIGVVSDVETFTAKDILIMNSDLLTTIDFEEMYEDMLAKSADMVVATIPYEVKIPYGVIETDADQIIALREKPTYTYYSNAGIYMIKANHLRRIPKEGVYTAPELIRDLCDTQQKVTHFPVVDYWLDIGKPIDYQRAQRDINHLKL